MEGRKKQENYIALLMNQLLQFTCATEFDECARQGLLSTLQTLITKHQPQTVSA